MTAVEFCGVQYQNPVMLAAGTAGFGRELDRVVDLDALGGIVTKANLADALALALKRSGLIVARAG